MSDVIEFIYPDDESAKEPIVDITLASESIPEWYQTLESIIDGVRTAKLCVSFADALRVGFLVKLNKPLEISKREIQSNDRLIHIPPEDGGGEVIQQGVNSTITRPNVLFDTGIEIQTPSDYSTLAIHPLNREYGELHRLTQLIETDKEKKRLVVPFVWDGRISEFNKGDDLIQCIPYYRPTVNQLQLREIDHAELPKLNKMMEADMQKLKRIEGYYRRFCWESKRPQTLHTTSECHNEICEDSDSESSQREFEVDNQEGYVTFRYYENNSIRQIPSPKQQQKVEWLKANIECKTSLNQWLNAAFTTGWVTYTHADVRVNASNGVSEQPQNDVSLGVISQMPEKSLGDNHYMPKRVSKVLIDAQLNTPAGISSIMTGPVNHRMKHYQAYTGIVDTDRFSCRANSIGICKSEEFTLPRKSPVSQIIPFDREHSYIDGVITK